MTRVAILDAEVVTFTEHHDDIGHLEPFDVIMATRERTPFTRERLERLPSLKLLVTAGMGNAAIDKEAARELGSAPRSRGSARRSGWRCWRGARTWTRRSPRKSCCGDPTSSRSTSASATAPAG